MYMMPFDILRHVNPRAAGRIVYGGGGGGGSSSSAPPKTYRSTYPELKGKVYKTEQQKKDAEAAVRKQRQVAKDKATANKVASAAKTAATAAAKNPQATLEKATANLNSLRSQLATVQQQAAKNPNNKALQTKVNQLKNQITSAENTVNSAQSVLSTNLKIDQQQMVSQVYDDPTKLVTTAEVGDIDTKGTEISSKAGQLTGKTPTAILETAKATTAAAVKPQKAETYKADMVASDAAKALKGVTAAEGEVDKQAQVKAAQGTLSPEAMAEATTFDPAYIQTVEAGKLNVTPEQLVTAAGQDQIAPSAKIAKSTGIDPAVAVKGTVSEEELPDAAQIDESNIAQAEAVTSDGLLRENATAVAARLDSFNVDSGTLAAAAQGDITAKDTVQGQLAELMKQFNDGTPNWAAGAIRSANAAMIARGLGSSSMAGAAILQAAMESAIPIAAQDAQTFAAMNMSNVDRRQQVALANAAAAQGLALANLSNEQQAALQNSANAFALQAQDLSNMQQAVIASAQIKSALQGQNLSNQQQSNLAIAARFAESANMNLNNAQQTALQNNSNNLTIDMANLSNKQQSYIINAQLEASLQGKIIDNQQQAAIANAARYAEAANLTFSAEEQAKLHNSELMKTIGLAELNASQAATLQNAAQMAAMDMANLDNRQQAAVQNAKAFLEMDMANLNNDQQTTLFKAQAQQQALLSDQAALNAAMQFNASSENQTKQFFANLTSQMSQFNASQVNAMKQFNAGQENAMSQFNASMKNQRDQFNATNSLVVAQANAQWRQTVATTEFAAQHEANLEAAKSANALTESALDQLWQRERDLMSYAWKSSESEMDRALSIILADKNLEAVRAQIDAEEDAAKGAFWAKTVFSAW